MDNNQWIKGILKMFYIIPTPSEYICNMENGNHSLIEAWPIFTLFIVLENIILFVQQKSTLRFNDGLTSISHGIVYESAKILTRGLEFNLYSCIHRNYKIVDFCWDHLLLWYMAAIIVDFFYYWVHRASHEIHILWAQHQVHHSSEDYNLTVGLRHPFLQSWCGLIFYLPMAFFLPPMQFILHQHISLLYQFWMHTSVIDHLGPLELIFNTPRHHRAHHGSNKRFLDKNYGGFLIIWDRMFGTFIESEPADVITYGLVVQPHTFNPLYLQLFYNKYVYNKFRKFSGWSNKMQSIIKGPSWLPGRLWTGSDADKIDVTRRDQYNPRLHAFVKLYLSLHFNICLGFFYRIATLSEIPSSSTIYYVYFLYVLFSLTVFGMFLDCCPSVTILEAVRCCLPCLFSNYIDMPQEYKFWLKIVYGGSVAWWICQCVRENLMRHYIQRVSTLLRRA